MFIVLKIENKSKNKKFNKIIILWKFIFKHIKKINKQENQHQNKGKCDIVFAHRYDMNTLIEETCRDTNYLIKEGYTFC